MEISDLTGDDLLQVLATLANPHRLRVVAALAAERNYVSRLARQLDISRALLQVHLRKLEAAGLVRADIEVSADTSPAASSLRRWTCSRARLMSSCRASRLT